MISFRLDDDAVRALDVLTKDGTSVVAGRSDGTGRACSPKGCSYYPR
jgi:hypothetical protein